MYMDLMLLGIILLIRPYNCVHIIVSLYCYDINIDLSVKGGFSHVWYRNEAFTTRVACLNDRRNHCDLCRATLCSPCTPKEKYP